MKTLSKNKIFLVKKIKLIHIKVIDGHSLSFGDITYKTIPVEVAPSSHNILVIFNMIKSPSNSIILELFLKQD